jgi:hypothetical protein
MNHENPLHPHNETPPEVERHLSPIEEIIAARGLGVVKFTHSNTRPAGSVLEYGKLEEPYDKSVDDSPSEGDVMEARHDLALRDIWAARRERDGINYIPADPNTPLRRKK